MTALPVPDHTIQTACESALKAVRRPSANLGMIDMGEAIRRVGNSDQYQGSKSRGAIKSWVQRLVQNAPEHLTENASGRLWLHPSLHSALSCIPHRERSAESLKTLSQKKRSRALAKLTALRGFTEYCRCGEGLLVGKTDARLRFVKRRQGFYSYNSGHKKNTLPLSVGTLKRWEKLFREGGIDALAKDGRGKSSTAFEPSDDAIQLYWSLRNDKRKFTIAVCHRLVADEASQRKWNWFSSLHTLSAWDRRHRNDRALVLNQSGDHRYQQVAGRYIELDVDSYAPNQCWVGDDHTLNCWVKLPNGKIVRPILSTWQDWRTRVIVGVRICQTGTEHSLLLGFSDAADTFGLPEIVIADNGKNFTSWQWRGNTPKRRVYRKAEELAKQCEGIFALCGITPSWCLPYNSNGKARLERWFRTLDEQAIRLTPSYCGKCPEDRPEAHVKLVAKAIEWEDFERSVVDYIAAYNNTPHSGEGMKGRTPLQVMAMITHRRVIDDNIRPLLLASWHRPVSISRNGIAIRVAGATVRYGATEPALQNLAIGTKVRISYDPQDMNSVAVWTMDYSWLCSATCNQRLNRSVTSEALRETMRAITREKRSLRKARGIGLNHLRDPLSRAASSLNHDSDKNRLPDPDQDGSPLLVPVHTPLKAPQDIPLRKAVGAEDTEVFNRLSEFAKKSATKPKGDSVWSALSRFTNKESS